MKLNKVVANPALALTAGLGLAACGSQAASVSQSAPAANYGGQYEADVAHVNNDMNTVSADPGATMTSPDVIAVGAGFTQLGRTPTSQTWPADAQADIKTLALDVEKVSSDVTDQDSSAYVTDQGEGSAEAQIVRSDLGLPAAPTG
jgi:hypothetical protein